MKRLIATLLHYANQDPPGMHAEFYALKERLLRRHGRIVGSDVQEIRKDCWGPWGDQYGERQGCLGENCPRCRGTGIYDIKWISLERWEWCGYVFHRPAFTIYTIPDIGTVTIFGRVQHKHHSQICTESALWLFLLCGEWRLFWRTLTSSRYAYCRLWPLLNLQRIVYSIWWRIGTRRCFCGKKFLHFGSGWQVCRKCRQAKTLFEIPF